MVAIGRLKADWTALRTFWVVVECGGFGAAARSLGVSPSTITRHIEDLEARLEVKLLTRRAQGVALTEAGTAVFDHVRTMERSAESLEREVLRRDRRMEGIVQLASPDGVAAFVVTPAIPRFLQANPKIQLKIDCGLYPGNPMDGDTDIALTFKEPTDSDVIARPLGYFHYALFASPSYLEIYGTPDSVEAATPHRYIPHSELTHQGESWDPKVLPFFALANRAVVTNSSSVSLFSIQNGAGIGMLPTVVSAFDPSLVMLDFPPLAKIRLWMYYHRDLAKSARIRLVVEWLEDIFDPRSKPWLRPEFIHPSDFGQAREAPRAALRIAK